MSNKIVLHIFNSQSPNIGLDSLWFMFLMFADGINDGIVVKTPTASVI